MNILKKIRIYKPFAVSVFQRILSYKMNFFFYMTGDLVLTFVVYYLWRAVFQSSGQTELEGFSLSVILVYIFMSEISSKIVDNRTDANIAEEVLDGSISMNLIKPVNYRTRLLFSTLGSSIYRFIAVGIPIWLGLELYRYFALGENFHSLQIVLLYLISISLSLGIIFLINFTYGLLSFYITNLWGFRQMKNVIIVFLSGRLIPLVFFPDWLQKVLNFLPFSSINYTPVMIYIGKYTGVQIIYSIALQLFWLISLFYLSEFAWKRSVKRLTILGG